MAIGKKKVRHKKGFNGKDWRKGEERKVNTSKKRALWQFTSRTPDRREAENLAAERERKAPVGLRLGGGKRGRERREGEGERGGEGEMSCSVVWPQHKNLPSHMCCHG